MAGGVCMVGEGVCGGRGCTWRTVNEPGVRILLECILVMYTVTRHVMITTRKLCEICQLCIVTENLDCRLQCIHVRNFMSTPERHS